MTGTVDLQYFVESRFENDRQARGIADNEREKAAQALAVEREKVAQALAVSLAERISAGDTALHDHINQQVAQINAALKSGELLEIERIAAVLQELRSHVSLVAALRQSDQEAVHVAFDASNKLSNAHNDLLRKMEKLSESFATILYVRDAFEAASKIYADQRAQDDKSSDRRFNRIENYQSRITGGLIAMGAVGIVNLIQTIVTGFS